MSLYQLILEEIVNKALEQLKRMLVGDNSTLKQLFSLKPIEFYDSDTTLDFEGAKVSLGIKSYIENMIEKRLSNPLGFLDISKWGTKPSFSYKFHVVVNAKMDYQNAGIYLSKVFVNHPFEFENGKYHLLIEKIIAGQEKNHLYVDFHLSGKARFWKFHKNMAGVLRLTGDLLYIPEKKLVKTKSLDYTIITDDRIVKQIDKMYHTDFRKYLEDFLQLNIREELFSARVAAQEEMNRYQSDPSYVLNGILHDLDMERVYFDHEGLKAVFLAQGNLHLNR